MVQRTCQPLHFANGAYLKAVSLFSPTKNANFNGQKKYVRKSSGGKV